MRVFGLFALILFIPAFAHAAPPTLTTYTVSQDTIYPNATADTGSATTTSIDTAFSEQVRVSIKIMSASGSTIKSLYTSSGVTNPTPKIWDGTNTAGALVGDGSYTILISATSTATGLTLTDSSKTVVVASPSSDSGASSDSTVSTVVSSGGTPEYIPIPALRILAGGDRTVSSGADTAFIAVVYDDKGNKRDESFVQWSFGDGMRRTGANVLHAYADPGEYVAVVRASTPDGGEEKSEFIVTVKNAGIKITAVSSRGITLANEDSRTLDLSLWRLVMGGREFKIPADTQILPGRTVLFPTRVTELPASDAASLLLPSGEVAAVYPGTTISLMESAQPPASATRYERVQAVEPITSTRTEVQTYEKAALAPREVTNTSTSRGAAVPAVSDAEVASPSLLRSPWTLGFLGVVALAGGAFILL